jgi:hypothetical protein
MERHYRQDRLLDGITGSPPSAGPVGFVSGGTGIVWSLRGTFTRIRFAQIRCGCSKFRWNMLGRAMFDWIMFGWIMFDWIMFGWIMFGWIMFGWIMFGRAGFGRAAIG